MTTVMPTHARTGIRRSRATLSLGALTAALGLSLLTPAPAGAAVMSPEHLVTPGISLSVDDTAHPDEQPAALAATGLSASRRVVSTEVITGGDKGARVRWIQRILGVPQTGFFGPATRDAVIRFQEGTGVSAGTGMVGPVTQRQLQAYGEAKAKVAAKKAAAARKAAAAAEAARKAAARKAAQQEATRGTTRPAPAPSTSGGGDPTMTAAARGSRAARQAVPFAVWRNSAHARMIVARESGGSCTAVSRSGAYRGTWQMGAPFWRSFGGLAFAPTPDQATCGEQDYVAYRGWIASWWSPWGG
jgi:peptidoglycan hydrolase-like protein with peptidoglycan-binding domain